jgi:hypothetical protein
MVWIVDDVSVGVATDDIVVVGATIVDVVSVLAALTTSVPVTAIAPVPVVGAVESAVAVAADSVEMRRGSPVPVVPVTGDRSVAFPEVCVSAACGFSLQAKTITSSITTTRRRIPYSFR